ncbi:hypothetical protein ABZ464_20130 [Streptomyces sp. NPDC005820]|uniref:hypothetical protein n=1 Tax=Streptomyces sp. NPDC005820 TaxID=3157069 RepID=UPI0033D3A7A6
MRPVRLDAVSVDPAPDDLVRAWKATREHRNKEPREAVWIPLLYMFREYFSRRGPGLEAALRAEGMPLMLTRREVSLQLGSRCFHLGQKLFMDGQREPGRFLLNEAVRALEWGDRNGQKMPIARRCTCNGQLAVALVLLARDLDETDPEAVGLLQRAERHSAFAEQEDKSEEHFAYRAEIHLRLFRAERTTAHLEKAHTVLLALRRPPASRGLRATRADVLAGLGLVRLRSGQFDEGIRLLREAEAAYSDARATGGPSNLQGAHPGYLLARRGHVRHQLYRFDVDAVGRRSTARLEDALSDLLAPETAGHMSGRVIAAALVDRSRVRQRRRDRAGSAADLVQARALLDTSPESAGLAVKLRVRELDDAVDRAVADRDTDALRRLAGEIVALPSDTPIPSTALARACRSMVVAEGIDRCRLLLEDALDRIEIDIVHPELSPPGQRHVAGNAALVARLLARADEEAAPAALDRALTLYRLSFDALDDPAGTDAYADAGACALDLAKALAAGDDADSEDAAGLLHEAVGWLQKSLAKAGNASSVVRPDYDPVIVHSRLGEAALRSYALTPTDRLLELAIKNLEESLALESADGETARLRPERDRTAIVGHLGDAYYRRGTRNRDADDLKRALELKEETYTGGNRARENRSLAAAAAERLHRITEDDTQLTRSAGCALQAATCDPAWPWPVLQLADLARQHETLDPSHLAGLPPAFLSEPLLAGDRPALLQRAAELAARNREFAASVLGGQRRTGEQGVFVLNDGHRLIEQTIVLKRLDAAAAAREWEWTQRFRQWLTERHAPADWQLPEPLGLVPVEAPPETVLEQEAVYVMRRMQGRLLGATVTDRIAGGEGDPLPHFARALRYLAAFQAWRALDDAGTPRTATARHAQDWAAQVTKACDKLDASGGLRKALQDLVHPLAAPGRAVVAKKDPHPGNWILTRHEALVLIDVESKTTLPLLQEAVTVIDDLPLVPLDEEGWALREELCAEYLAALTEFGLPMPAGADVLADSLEALAVLHAVKGIGRIRRWSHDVSSFTLSLRGVQYAHYWSILDHLAAHGRDRTARAFCRLFLTEFRREPAAMG